MKYLIVILTLIVVLMTASPVNARTFNEREAKDLEQSILFHSEKLEDLYLMNVTVRYLPFMEEISISMKNVYMRLDPVSDEVISATLEASLKDMCKNSTQALMRHYSNVRSVYVYTEIQIPTTGKVARANYTCMKESI